MEMKRGLPCGHLMLIHESVYSHRSSVRGACFGQTVCPTHSHSSMQSQRFPSSTWTLTRSSSFPWQPWCIPAAWHFWHGLALLGSVGLQQHWQGLLCLNGSCCAADGAYFVDRWKGVRFFSAKGFSWLPGDGVGLGEGFCCWHVTV